MKPIPKTNKQWLKEIAEAYLDANGTLVFDPSIKETDLYSIAPDVAIKFRQIKKNKKEMLEKAKEGAFSSYLATKDHIGEAMENPIISFSFCYIASHYAIELIEEDECSEILDYVVDNFDQLLGDIENKI